VSDRDRITVLFVEPSAYTSYGGSKRVLVHLAGGLDPRRWRARALCYRPGPWVADLEGQGVSVTVASDLAGPPAESDGAAPPPLAALRWAGARRTELGSVELSWPRRWARDLRSLARLAWSDARRAARIEPHVAQDVDLLHLNDSMHSDYAWYHVAMRRRVPYVLHEHRLWRNPPRAWRRVALAAGAVLCLTRERMELVRSACGEAARVELLPNAVPARAFAASRSRDEVRRSLGLAPDELLLITAGHLQAWKGQDLAIDAGAHLARAGVPFRWILCGSTIEPEFERRLRDRIASAGLGERVRLLGMRNDLPDLFSASDLAVHTSIHPDPFGMTVLEAMAAGAAIVGPSEGGIPDMVRDGRDGRLYTPRDPEALARTIEATLRDRDALRAMGASARARARESFALEGQVSRLEAIYEKVLAASGARRRDGAGTGLAAGATAP
jgi:glycosyltransferase involved in cell wall biosynthesis